MPDAEVVYSDDLHCLVRVTPYWYAIVGVTAERPFDVLLSYLPPGEWFGASETWEDTLVIHLTLE